MVGQTQLIDKLRELGRNLWWTWQPNVIALFRELDPALWRKVDHNPVEFLKRLRPEKKFASMAALSAGIAEDVLKARAFLKKT